MFPTQEISVQSLRSCPGKNVLSPEQETSQRPWQVLHVRSNFEKRVAEHLAIRAIEHYLPLYRERVRWSDRTVIAERPLFSGYVFARYAPEVRVTVISTPGVVRSLGEDERSLVNSAEVEKIRMGMASGLMLRPHPNVTAGTRVRIRTGIFAGVEGVVTEFRQQCKVVLALAAVRQCFSIEIELRDIEVLEKQPVAHADLPNHGRRNYWSVQVAQP